MPPVLRQHVASTPWCAQTLAKTSRYTFPIIRRDVDDVLTVTDEQLVGCMSFAASRMKLVIEPTGCLGFAAARQMKSQLRPEGT